MSELNLYQKIQAVSNEVKNIEKNMTVGKGNYAYKAVQDIDVLLAVKKAETEIGILSIPIKQELIKSEIVKILKDNGSEGISYVDIVKMTVRILDVNKPDSFIDVESFGRGLDAADKGFGKAATYARKYALLNAYKIATGEDPDDNKSNESKAVSDDSTRNIVVNYLLKDNDTLVNMLTHFNKGSVDDFSKQEINSIYTGLKQRRML